MTTFLIGLLVILGLCVLRMILLYFDEKEEEKEKEREFGRCIEDSFLHVKKYCGKFPASLDHLKTVVEAFEELTNGDGLKYLKQFEGYRIPTNQFHFIENFYILVDKDLTYKIVISDECINIRDEFNDVEVCDSAETVKRYLPYAKTLEEFKEFFKECQEEYQNGARERERRNHVASVIKRKVK